MRPVEYKDREQTYLKHLFLERYLETVAYHIGYFHREFVYVDCFAGPWRAVDQDLGDTSIAISLQRLNSVRDGLALHGKNPTIRAMFIEQSPAAFTTLRQMLQERSGNIVTTALPGTFEENIPAVVDRLGSTFAFFFIDPTGWTGFAMENIRPILRRGHGEVMINFMYDFINRNLNNADAEESLDQCFGTPAWRMIRDSPNRGNRETASVELYMEQIRSTGDFPYVTSTRILKPLSERAYFHLIYATRNPKGLVKFRDVEWKVAEAQEQVRAVAQREHRERQSHQTELDFELGLPSNAFLEERLEQLRKAEARLLDLLGKDGSMRYETLQPHILELRLVRKNDLNTILGRLRKAGRIRIDGLGARERVPKPGCTIHLLSPPK